ncbi:arginine repressor [Trueperella pyogenes]|jgi:arginine repressor|uniref:arginine repressor n=1 Tax=Trueperella pyogenes TaxID=1661 RepID=UPI0006618152|nr:arginine repressor [Trueperella pyogenes]MBF1737362.1 arginine repressor [Trueperella pyogenes]
MSSEATPQTKAGRHAAIRNLLVSQTISSQEQLRSALGSQGIEVTQATLSRDLMEMRATKMRDRSGALIYSVPNADGSQSHEAEASVERLQRWLQTLLVTSTCVGNQLVLRTLVGAANLLGSALDVARIDDVVGTIAGDDTVLIICTSAQGALNAQDYLTSLAGGGSQPSAL